MEYLGMDQSQKGNFTTENNEKHSVSLDSIGNDLRSLNDSNDLDSVGNDLEYPNGFNDSEFLNDSNLDHLDDSNVGKTLEVTADLDTADCNETTQSNDEIVPSNSSEANTRSALVPISANSTENIDLKPRRSTRKITPTLKKKQLEDEENDGGFNEENNYSNTLKKRKRSLLGPTVKKVPKLKILKTAENYSVEGFQKKKPTIKKVPIKKLKKKAKNNSLRKVQKNNSSRHQCSYCDKSYTSKTILKQHVDRDHLGKGYECNVCWKKFSSKSHHRRHNRFHTGEKPYRCKTCKKGFTQNDDLKKHLKTRIHKRKSEKARLDQLEKKNP